MNIFRYLVVIFILSYSSIAPAMAQKANVDKLDENVYAINLLGYTSLVVIGDEDVLITDTANTYRANFLKETIAELTDKPVTKIVLSHEHFDHTGGSQVFDGAEVIAQQNALAVINLDPLDSFPDRIDVVFKERLTFDLGTTTVELRHLGAADGVAATIVYLPNEKIALTADTYSQARLTPAAFLTDTNQLGVRKILNELVSLNLKHAVTAHSTSTDPAAVIENAEYFNKSSRTASFSISQSPINCGNFQSFAARIARPIGFIF